MTLRRTSWVLTLTVLAVLAGCAPADPGADPSAGPVTQASPNQNGSRPASPAGSATPSATLAPVVWSDEAAVAIGEHQLGLPTAATVEESDQGWRRVGLTVDPAAPTGLVLEAPGLEFVSAAFTVDGQGFATRPTATDGAGALVDAAFVKGERGPLLRLDDTAVRVEFLVGERLLATAEWESETRVLITPTQLGRELATGDPVAAAAWAPLALAQLESDPRLAGESVVNQLACHMIGARDKPTWNLETDRADKGLIGFMAARCN